MIKNIFRGTDQAALYREFIQDLEECCVCSEVLDCRNEDGTVEKKKLSLSLDNLDDIKKRVLTSDIKAGNYTKVHLDIQVECTNLEDQNDSSTFLLRDIINLPVCTKEGMNINGRKQFINELTVATGWQIERTHKDIEITYRPARGSILKFYFDNTGRKKKVNVGCKRKSAYDKETSSKIAMSTMLKAFVNNTDDEIIREMFTTGSNNSYLILPTANEKSSKLMYLEDDLAKCKHEVLELLLPFAVDDKDTEYLFEKQKDKSSKYAVSEDSLNRVNNFFSFANRCLNQILGEDIRMKDGSIIKSGEVLTYDILIVIDASELEEIYINKGREKLRVLKYKINENFDENHILNIANIICCELDGISTINDLDSTENKSMKNCYTVLREYTQYYVQSKIMETLSKNLRATGNIILTKKELISMSCDFAEEIGVNGHVTCVRGINPRNTLAMISLESQITSPVKNVSSTAIAVSDIDRGFVDSVASPESKKVGITQNLSSTTFSDKYGQLCNYFCKLENGCKTENIVVLNISEAYNNKVITGLFKDGSDSVNYMYRGNKFTGAASEAGYCFVTPASISSRWASLAVGFEHNKARRVQMSQNHGNQYLPILGAERRLFSSGMASTFTEKAITCEEIVESLCVLNGVGFTDELVQKGIELVGNINTSGETITYTFRSLDTSLKVAIKKSVDYLATLNQFLWSYELNTKLRPELKWFGDEIVICPMDLDTTPTKVAEESNLDFGVLPKGDMVKRIEESELAMGLNLLTAVISWHGNCYEDGILIRQGLVDSLRVCNVLTHNQEIELGKDEITGKYSNNKKLNESGLPHSDLFYNVGETIVEYKKNPKVTSAKLLEGTPGEVVKKSLQVKEGYEGYCQTVTTKTKDKKTKIIVNLGQIKMSITGDKWTGHHGDKSVATRVIPDSAMPCFADGTPMDMCINPLGIPSRMNLGVLIEFKGSSVGFVKEMCKERTKVLINAPFNTCTKLFEDIDKIAGNESELYLYDPETLTRLPNKVTVGYRYIMKLDHNVEKKVSAISSPHSLNMKTGQPQKSKLYHGGQSISELALMSLVANRATTVIDYLFGSGSDDLAAASKMEHQIMETGKTDIVGENRTSQLMFAYITSLGYDVSGESASGVGISLLTDKRIGEISRKIYLESDSNITQILYNDSNHYNVDRYGKSEPSKSTFTHVDVNNVGWINPAILNSTLMSTLFVRYNTYKSLTLPLVKDILWGKKALKICNESYVDLDSNEEVRFKYAQIFDIDKNSISSQYKSTVSIKGIQVNLNTKEDGYYTGGLAFYRMFKEIGKNDLKAVMDIAIATEKVRAKADSIKLKKKSLDIMPSLDKLITNKLIMLPLGYRFANLEENMSDGMNQIYKLLIRQLRSLEQPTGNMVETNVCDFSSSTFVKTYNNFFCELFEVVNNSKFNKSKLKDNKGIKTPISLITSKKIGATRGYTFSKKIRNSFRSVIVGAADCDLINAFIPRKIIYETYKYKVYNWLKTWQDDTRFLEMSEAEIFNVIEALKNKNIGRLSTLLNIDFKESKELYKSIFDYVNVKLQDEIVLLVREPALLKYNTQCFIPVMWEESAIGINILICEGYNADFDGDQMAGFAILPERAKENARECLTPDKLLFEEQTGKLGYGMKFDILLGFFSATGEEPTEQKESTKTYSTEDLVFEFENHLIRADETILFTNKDLDSPVLTTVGRAYVACKLPDNLGFDNGKMRYNKVLNGKDVNKICLDMRIEDGKEYINMLNQMKNLGFKLQDLNNVSLGLDDFINIYRDDRYKNSLKDFSGHTEEKILTELFIKEGRFSDEIKERRKYLNTATENILSTMKEIVGTKGNLGKIFTSGARGSFNNLIDTMIQTGYVKGVGEKYANDVIETNLFEGYSTDDYFTAGNEARRSTHSTINGTADSGELGRMYGFDIGDERVIEYDCGAEPCEHKLLLKLKKDEEVARFLKVGLNQKIKEETSECLFFGGKLTSSSTLDIIEENNIKRIELENGEIFSFSYLPKKVCYDLYIDRYGHKLKDGEVDFTKQVQLKKEDIDEYTDSGRTNIWCRLTWDCKSIGGLCKKCYGNLITDLKLPPIEYSAGILSSQAIAQTMVQIALDVKNVTSDSSNQLGVTPRLKANLELSNGKKEVNAVYSKYEQNINVIDFGLMKAVKVNNVRYVVPNCKLLCATGTIGSGVKVIEGLNCYKELNNFMGVETIRDLMFTEYYTLYERNGIQLHPKHFEVLVKAQTRFAKVLSSNIDKLLPQTYQDRNYLDSLINEGADIEYQVMATSIFDSCLASGWLKAIAFQEFSKQIGTAVLGGYSDRCSSVYSSIAIGKFLSGESCNVKMDTFEKKAKAKVGRKVKEKKKIEVNNENSNIACKKKLNDELLQDNIDNEYSTSLLSLLGGMVLDVGTNTEDNKEEGDELVLKKTHTFL